MSIHPLADVATTKIGEGSRVWQYCVVLENAVLGKNCNICSHCFIENDVVIGNDVTVKCGVQLWDGIRLEDSVFIGPNVTFTNDKHPRSKEYPDEFAKTVVKEGASIGANATILPGITIGKRAMVGAGAVVTSDVPPGTVVAGTPATIRRYIEQPNPAPTDAAQEDTTNDDFSIAEARWINLGNVRDIRGDLTIVQWNQHLPFEAKRVFFVHHVPSEKVRGQHAHTACQQVLVCLNGSVAVVLDDGKQRDQVTVDRSDRGLLIPAGIWATQFRYAPNSVVAVFASHDYDESDYIRDYDDFLKYRASR